MRGRATTEQGSPIPGDLGPALRLRLLGGFALLERGQPVDVSPVGQRLLAFLALSERPAPRCLVAGTLWPQAGEEQALASLRSALWRVRKRGPVVTETRDGRLSLDRDVTTDVAALTAQARRILDRDGALEARDEDPALLRPALLPEWWDDWLLIERERLRQLQLHALERLAERLAHSGRFERALDAALLAVAAEPLRESPHRAVVAIHLAEGNRSEALRAYRAFRDLVREQLGVPPSERMLALIAACSGEAPGAPRGARGDDTAATGG